MTNRVRRRALVRRRVARMADLLRSWIMRHPRAGDAPPWYPDRFRFIVRRLRPAEYRIVAAMLETAGRLEQFQSRLDDAWVYEVNDGGMGGLRFVRPEGAPGLGEYVGPGSFLDCDGVEVFLWLNFDKHGNLFELDVWKVDEAPLIAYPATFPVPERE